MGAAVDCELIRSGFLGQPVNALTTLVFVVTGAWVTARSPITRWVGLGLVVTGVGSFLFHGPMPAVSEWAHDVGIAWLIVLIASLGRRWERWSQVPALMAIAGLFLLFPSWSDPISVSMTVVSVPMIVGRDRSSIGPVLLIGAGAIVGRLGATGGPWCDPASLFQPHALWHLAAAIGVTWWALTFRSGKPIAT